MGRWSINVELGSTSYSESSKRVLLYPDPLRVSLVSPMADQAVLTFTSFVNWILDMNDTDICGFVFNLESHVPPSDLALVIGGSWRERRRKCRGAGT